ncbi:CRISP/Allergen/PR-1-like [Dermacentor variabilis]|uniref:CRISP/Allergen/PR-1-like n=1 Tax=Dermacentor variabilis TaxID=34621 RepID=UPI003F5BFFAB
MMLSGDFNEVHLPPQYWDAELASVAQAHANQCTSEWAYKHDEPSARKTVNFDTVGQNTAWEAFNYDQSKRSWRVQIDNWIAEHADCPADRIAYFRDRDDGVRIGHFTELIWAETQYVGCGYSYYTLDGVEGDKKYQGFYVCNYAPTPPPSDCGHCDGGSSPLPCAQQRYAVITEPPERLIMSSCG